jgi:hypothetical protein
MPTTPVVPMPRWMGMPHSVSLRGHQVGGALLLEAQLGVGVDVAADGSDAGRWVTMESMSFMAGQSTGVGQQTPGPPRRSGHVPSLAGDVLLAVDGWSKIPSWPTPFGALPLPHTGPAALSGTAASSADFRPGASSTVRGACPHDCPDTCALLTTVENGRATGCRATRPRP